MIGTALAATEEAAAHAGPFYAQAEFWVAVAFVLVVGALSRPALRAITAALDVRADKIRGRLEEAQRLREEAQEMLATYQRRQRDALQEAEEILSHAKAEAARMREKAGTQLEESLKRREQQALERIAQAEAKATAEVRAMTVDIAIAATQNLIRENLTKKQAAALIEGAIKELPEKLH